MYTRSLGFCGSTDAPCLMLRAPIVAAQFNPVSRSGLSAILALLRIWHLPIGLGYFPGRLTVPKRECAPSLITANNLICLFLWQYKS